MASHSGRSLTVERRGYIHTAAFLTLTTVIFLWDVAAGSTSRGEFTERDSDRQLIDILPMPICQENACGSATETQSQSGVDIKAIDPFQTESLALLARIWGFVKYHHPRVTEGHLDWDAELFIAMRDVLAARSVEQRNRILADWLRTIGPPQPCDPCARIPDRPQSTPRLLWLDNEGIMGSEVVELLTQIYRNRSASDVQQYVRLHPDVFMPLFENEAAYDTDGHVDVGYRLLGLFRFWNIIEYWFPYRNLTDELWTDVLRDYIPRFVRADNPRRYRTEMLALAAEADDGHVTILNARESLPPSGKCRLPVVTRFVEGKAIVVEYADPIVGPNSGLQVSDLILAINGEPVSTLTARWSRYYGASNRAALYGYIASYLPRGACEPATLVIDRKGQLLSVRVNRVPEEQLAKPMRRSNDLPGDAFQILGGNIGYLKLSSIEKADIQDYIERASYTKGLIIDIRGYPNEFVVFELGQHLVEKPTQFVKFTTSDLANPGAFVWEDFGTRTPMLQPKEPFYDGIVVVLVDERTQSQAEYTAMALRSAPNTTIVGSMTAGADGNVTSINLPGGLQTQISGIGVFYPNGMPTQRVGIIPDVYVAPTVEGIRRGVDEVLERAVSIVEAAP